MESAICKICFDPVDNFVCLDCLAREVKKWLNSRLEYEFTNFNENLRMLFNSEENLEKCVRCRQSVDCVVCESCYLKELFLWLTQKGASLEALGLMNSFKRSTEINSALIVSSNSEEETSDLNVCEECGQVAELLYQNGKWICESCRDA